MPYKSVCCVCVCVVGVHVKYQFVFMHGFFIRSQGCAKVHKYKLEKLCGIINNKIFIWGPL